ncbi:MAG: hypothetical protein KatS3mg052_0061 [Candidatus Roseilinea sp.]|nr:MAG: hypothetical protein KatS3mg052_0061 [Candidatus Roseilinea sp.]
MRLDNLLRFDYWIDGSVTVRPAEPFMWLVVAIGLMSCLAAGWLRRSGRAPRDATFAWIIASGLVALVGLGRLFAIPVLGLRAGWLIAALLALAPLARRALSRARADGLVADCLRALSFGPPRAAGDWSTTTAALWMAAHLFGLAVVLANLNLPALLAPTLLALLLAPFTFSAALDRARQRPVQFWALSSLSPLTIAYVTTCLSFGGVRVEGLLNGVLSPLLSLIVMSALAFVIGGRWAAQRLEIGDWGFVRRSALLLVAASLGWAAWAALALRTHGVTGSDPYAYAQMGVDLATRGTVLHPFPLARLAYALDIPLHPVVHVGYRIPDGSRYEAPTVWPPGYAAFTGLAYLLAGERGLYLVTPLLNLFALIVSAWFAHHASHVAYQRTWAEDHVSGAQCQATQARQPDGQDEARAAPDAVAALTVFFTATSYQQVEWQMVPMADIAAQLFSILALTLAWRARGSLVVAGLSGLALGAAFDIRYTQVLIAPAIALALAPTRRETREATRATLGGSLPSYALRLASCALAAWIAASPVLMYHTTVFGGPFHVGSEELTNFSLARLPETLGRTIDELKHYREFGGLMPLILIGAAAMWRRSRRALAILAAYAVTLFLFHIAYAYLRLRDILSLFPVLHLLAAFGAVELWRGVSALRCGRCARIAQRLSPAAHGGDAMRSTLNQLLAIAAICALSYLFVLRAMETLALPVTRGFGAFGYLAREQRLSFERLRRMTPNDAVIGCALNSGAVDLHAGRTAFRPAVWTPDELVRFVDALHAEGRPVFLLDDGAELRASLATLRARYALREVGRLDLPYYEAVGGGSQNRRVPLFEIRVRR